MALPADRRQECILKHFMTYGRGGVYGGVNYTG